jgi:hypothetical protein
MTTDPQRGLKRWAAQPFEHVVAYLRETAEFAEAVTFGLRNTGRLALAEELFQELERQLPSLAFEDPSESTEKLKTLRERARKADKQLEDGLPLMHSQMAIGTWSVLEAAIDDFVVAWLTNVPATLEVDELSKIKVPASLFEMMDRPARMQYLVEEYKRNLRSDSKIGIERFESILKPLGLSGPVDESTRKDIFELSQVRNAILHRASRADQRLIDACPWLTIPLGARVVVSNTDSDRYVRSVTEYLKTIIKRVWQFDEAVA